MKFRSKRTKIRPIKGTLINILYHVGVKPKTMMDMFNVSSATIYRHIKR